MTFIDSSVPLRFASGDRVGHFRIWEHVGEVFGILPLSSILQYALNILIVQGIGGSAKRHDTENTKEWVLTPLIQAFQWDWNSVTFSPMRCVFSPDVPSVWPQKIFAIGATCLLLYPEQNLGENEGRIG